ncbi:MAG TPA: hypothetical protein DIT40_10305 [Alphaproteobacteria bacterium]|nr:hypothetical protein [Alphaproteobacteria bacterium]
MFRPFPWRRVMQAGLGLLRLPPADFWKMSLVELQLAVDGMSGPACRGAGITPASRADLVRLRARFPDDAQPE